MKAKWLIVNLGKDEHIERLFYGVQECGREVEVISLQETYDLLGTPSDERACIVTSGSIGINETRRKNKPNWVGCWHNEPLYYCSNYYSFWGKHISQKNYLMMPFAEIKRKKDWLFSVLGDVLEVGYRGSERGLFFRPDSGAKEFNGERVCFDRFKAWYEDAEDRLKTQNIPLSLMCVIASPLDIFREYRLVIKNGKVVTGSQYRLTGHISLESLEESFEKDTIIKFAEEVLADNAIGMPPVHVLDIAVDKDGPSVLEVGCYCCAGLYECDRKKIALAVSEAAEEEWERTEVKK